MAMFKKIAASIKEITKFCTKCGSILKKESEECLTCAKRSKKSDHRTNN